MLASLEALYAIVVYYIPKARQVTFSEKQFRSYIYAIPVMRVNQDHLYSVIQSSMDRTGPDTSACIVLLLCNTTQNHNTKRTRDHFLSLIFFR